jgi:hypothetical protein
VGRTSRLDFQPSSRTELREQMNALQAIVDGRSPDDERTLSFT